MGITDGTVYCSLCGEDLTGCALCGTAPMTSQLREKVKSREQRQYEQDLRDIEAANRKRI